MKVVAPLLTIAGACLVCLAFSVLMGIFGHAQPVAFFIFALLVGVAGFCFYGAVKVARKNRSSTG